ncbi:MAG: glycosyltransferase family 2 protein, partial [Kiritimatiellae bacterium]|nr:glycosyltransferase family 2 protein [Kiritimatiellia bacterium]
MEKGALVMPLASIILAVFNGEAHVRRALESARSQTLRDVEIICVNDGSNDGTADILDGYAAADARIKVISKPNGGLSSARNAALDIAQGKFVMFLDADDCLPPDAAEKMVRVAEESGVDIVASARFARGVFSKPRKAALRWKRKSPALAKMAADRHIHSSVWNKLYKRSAIGETRFIEGIFFEDWPFNLMVFAGTTDFALVDEEMYAYCDTGESITRSPFTMAKA